MILTQAELWQALQFSEQVILSAEEHSMIFDSSEDFRFFCEDLDVMVVADQKTKLILSWNGFPYYRWVQDVSQKGNLDLNLFPDSILAELFFAQTPTDQAAMILRERLKAPE